VAVSGTCTGAGISDQALNRSRRAPPSGCHSALESCPDTAGCLAHRIDQEARDLLGALDGAERGARNATAGKRSAQFPSAQRAGCGNRTLVLDAPMPVMDDQLSTTIALQLPARYHDGLLPGTCP
jgi:hypothetical protein